jgi:hypothetical protein
VRLPWSRQRRPRRPTLDRAIDALIAAMATAVSPGCAIFTHELRGAAARVSANATAFGLGRDHLLIGDSRRLS